MGGFNQLVKFGARSRSLAVGVLVLGSFAVSAAPAGAAVQDASCDAAGHVAISPPLSAPTTAADFTLSMFVSSSAGTCPSLPTHQGTMKGTLHSPAASCDKRNIVHAEPAVGTVTVQWSEESSSTIA